VPADKRACIRLDHQNPLSSSLPLKSCPLAAQEVRSVFRSMMLLADNPQKRVGSRANSELTFSPRQ
jgi:hypothetical protein